MKPDIKQGRKKVAVTGASGHIGANLVRELLDRGLDVTAVVRQDCEALKNLDVTLVRGELLEPESLCRAFKGIDDVYHLAAYVTIQSGQKKQLDLINIEGTRHVIDACRREGVSRLIYFSSIHALDQTGPGREVNENNPLVNSSRGGAADYDYSKAMADRLVRDASCTSLKTCIIYPTAVIGPNDFKPSLAGSAILKMAQGRLPALVAGGYNWVDARDVAWGAVEAAERATGDSRYILSGHYVAVPEVARTVSELGGVATPAFTCPLWLARMTTPFVSLWARVSGRAPLYTRYSLAVLSEDKVISHALATEELGYQPRSFQTSIKDALDFYSGPGPIEQKQRN